MADKKLNFIISADNSPAIKALSQISVALNKVNTAFKAQSKPSGKGGGGALDPKALNAIGDELKNVNSIFKTMGASQNQWERNAGFTNLQKSFKGTAEEAVKLRGAVTSILAPLMALTGIGGVGAMAKMASDWGGAAQRIKETMFSANVGQGYFQREMGLGKMFGIDSDTVASGMAGFAMNMRDTAFSQNAPLQGFLASHKVQNIRGRFERGEQGGIEGLKREIFDIIDDSGVTGVSKMKMLQLTGLGSFAPEMALGKEERHKRQDISDKYGYATPDQIALANDYKRSLYGLDRALEALHRNMSDKIIPEFQPIIQGFSNWIAKADSAKAVFDQLSIAVGVTLVGAIWVLGKAILASPLGRALVLLDGVINGAKYIGGLASVQAIVAQSSSAWDRFHPKNFGTNKSMMESPQEYQDRTGSFANGQDWGEGGLQRWKDKNGIKTYVPPAGPAASSGITVSGNAPPQVLGTIQITGSVPPGTKVTVSPAAGMKMPTNINHSGFIVP